MEQTRTFKYKGTELVTALNRFAGIMTVGAFFALFLPFFRALRPPVDATTLLTISVAWLYLFPWAIMFALHFPSIQVSESQLVIRTLLVFPIKLDWSEVTRVYSCEPMYSGYHRQIEAMWIVETKRMTIFHRVFVWLFTKRWQPGFMLASNLPGHNDLLQIICEHLGTEQCLHCAGR